MHILVTNDDGVNAPGLLALAQAMRELGKVSVLAPDHNWSASGHVKTLDHPLRVKAAILADGTPALAYPVLHADGSLVSFTVNESENVFIIYFTGARFISAGVVTAMESCN